MIYVHFSENENPWKNPLIGAGIGAAGLGLGNILIGDKKKSKLRRFIGGAVPGAAIGGIAGYAFDTQNENSNLKDRLEYKDKQIEGYSEDLTKARNEAAKWSKAAQVDYYKKLKTAVGGLDLVNKDEIDELVEDPNVGEELSNRLKEAADLKKKLSKLENLGVEYYNKNYKGALDLLTPNEIFALPSRDEQQKAFKAWESFLDGRNKFFSRF